MPLEEFRGTKRLTEAHFNKLIGFNKVNTKTRNQNDENQNTIFPQMYSSAQNANHKITITSECISVYVGTYACLKYREGMSTQGRSVYSSCFGYYPFNVR